MLSKEGIRKSIITKISLSIIFSLVVLIIVEGFFIYGNFFNITMGYLKKNLISISNDNANNINTIINNFNNSFDMVANDTDFVKFLNYGKSEYIDLVYEKQKNLVKFNNYLSFAKVSGIESSFGLLILNDYKLQTYSQYDNIDIDNEDLFNNHYGIFNDYKIKNNKIYNKLLETNSVEARIFLSENKEVLYICKVLNNSISDEHFGEKMGLIIYGIKTSGLNGKINLSKLTKGTKAIIFNDSENIVYSSDNNLYDKKLSNVFELKNKLDINNYDQLQFEQKGNIIQLIKLKSGYNMATIIPISDFSNEASNSIQYILIISIIAVIIGAFVILLTITIVIRPIKVLTNKIKNIENFEKIDLFLSNEEREKIIKSNNEITFLWESFDNLFKDINKYILELDQSNKKQRDSEIKALQAEINPHFLYNTLDTICSVAMLKREMEIVKMISILSSILRYNIKSPYTMVRLSEEIEHIKNYVEIQKLRMRDKFEVEYNLDEDILECEIPKLIIQPLIENSLIHGVFTNAIEGHILLECKSENGNVIINVIDNGNCENVDEINRYINDKKFNIKQKESFGIRNVHERIQLKFGNEYGLSYEKMQDGKTKAKIVIPRIGCK